LRGAKGDHKKVLYTNGPQKDEEFSMDNRYNSGVETSYATPCNAAPFAHLSYDRWVGASLSGSKLDKKTGRLRYIGLQTDEWPMAAFWTDNFDSNAQIPQVSLRCINNANNSNGGQSIMNFRRCHGEYKAGGEWEAHRYGAAQERKQCKELDEGDTFQVYFNLMMFDVKNQSHVALRK
jgi:hypothetical protein